VVVMYDGQAGDVQSAPITAAQLAAIDFAEPEWVIQDILPIGVHLLVGKPKKGKSWLALGACESIATGGKAFGVKKVREGTSLYLALEDNRRRLQKRLKKVLEGRPAPEQMYLETFWPRLHEGGAERLDLWLRDHPDTRLVVVDTLAKIRKPVRGRNIYDEDYGALEVLLPIAHEHGVAIVVVYHLRKEAAADPLDEISSSTGLTAGVDGFLILRRAPGSKGPTLYVDGRDIEDPMEYTLTWNFDTATWTIEGAAEEVHLSKQRADILLTITRAGRYMTPREVTDVLGSDAKYTNVKSLMWKMDNDGQLLNNEGAYFPANPTTLGNPGSHGNPGNSGNRGNPAADQGSTVTELPLGNRNGNRTLTDAYVDNGDQVTGVTGVAEVGEPLTSSPIPPTGSVAGRHGRRLTDGEVEEVKRRIYAGMEPARARAEVLGEDVPDHGRDRPGRRLAIEAMELFANEELESWEEEK
jgi:AAA domain